MVDNPGFDRVLNKVGAERNLWLNYSEKSAFPWRSTHWYVNQPDQGPYHEAGLAV